MQIVKRVFQILRIVVEHGPTELRTVAALSGLKTNTAWNILHSLMNEGVVSKVGRGRYAVGPEVSRLAAAREPLSTRLPILAQSVADQLSSRLNETVVVCVLERDRLVVIADAEAAQPVRVGREVYREGDLVDWATGRVLLAHLPMAHRARLLTENGIAPDTQEPAFTAIRRCGGATRLTHAGQVRSLAVPVFGTTGLVVAAIGVVLPASRDGNATRRQVEKALRRAADSLRVQLDTG